MPADVDVVIVSAEHGLISCDERIAPYDRRLDRRREGELVPQVMRQMEAWVGGRTYGEVLVVAGADYVRVVSPALRLAGLRWRAASGGIGSKMREMREWLLS